MTLPTAVPVDSAVTVTVTASMTHLCPFVDEVDHGTITITWQPDTEGGHTIELHSLRAYLDGFAEDRIAHEDLTRRVADDLDTLPGLTVTAVESGWLTAGMGVRCSTTPTRAAQP